MNNATGKDDFALRPMTRISWSAIFAGAILAMGLGRAGLPSSAATRRQD